MKAALNDPEHLVPNVAIAPVLTGLSASMVTGDLLGRYHVAREAEAAGFRFTDLVDRAFPGQALFAAVGDLSLEPLPPEEAIQFFRDKIPMTRAAFDEAAAAYRARAFTIAGQQRVAAVKVIKDWLEQALAEGLTFKDFLDGLDEAAAAGGIREVNPYLAETVFRTNIQTAYGAGRYEMYHAEGMAEAFPFFQYHTVGDDRVRWNHAAMDGYVARRDAPVWDEWWVPNGFNCRCTITAVSAVEATREGIRPSRRAIPRPDEGFAGNAAKNIREV